MPSYVGSSQLIKCECGAYLSKHCMTKHLKTAKHNNLLSDPDYYKEATMNARASEYKKQYHESHREEILEKVKTYKENHREETLANQRTYRSTTIRCECCDVEVPRNHISEHRKTKKHQKKEQEAGSQ